MPALPAQTRQLSPDAESALLAFLQKHLRTQGINLGAEQLREISQQAPVTQLLDAVLASARQLLPPAPQEAITLVPAAAPVPTPAAAAAGATTTSAQVNSYRDVAGQAPLAAPAAPAAAPASAATTPPTPPPAAAAAAVASPAPEIPVKPVPPAPRTVVRLPNGTAGQHYTVHVDLAKSAPLAAFRVGSLEVPADSGLVFDAATGRLSGVPQAEPGLTREHQFQGRLVSLADGTPSPAVLRVDLLINPDPRSLWKQLEPDADLPFRKEHRRSAELPGKGLRTVAASVRGRSHANSGSFREDDFHLDHDRSGGWTLVAVSDGAGSARLSRRGSDIACRISCESLQASIAALDEQLDALLPLATLAEQVARPEVMESLRQHCRQPLGSAAFTACKAIREEAQALGAQEKDLSATLLVAAVRPYGDGFFVAAYWIGDGAAALFDPQQPDVNLLGDADSGEYSGQTRFLQSGEFPAPDPWPQIDRRVRCAWGGPGSILALMSDGVSDPKFGTDNALKNPVRWQEWWKDVLAGPVNPAPDNAALPEELTRYLDFWSQGEHDDRTLALVFRTP
ncbi:protein phosphatase 2C domain-containing protein [Solimonas sp. K1W22B-7]|uniref:PP2C family serine/threonine-protein phosphatase n=1 Tax=Solimonas sp. K1W22B-7 TaxID=2303331 RepID=UPI000E330571|nr:PP2C family serine/threonine-protein phosphatase [Solimonas sp. K1W22B-7]AXQ27498.1 protein phosphatase 2C domain-containing protein [Solimonas sp. K1W22B-7]